MIYQFIQLKKVNHIPKNTHVSIQWSRDSPLKISENNENVEFKIIAKVNKKKQSSLLPKLHSSTNN